MRVVQYFRMLQGRLGTERFTGSRSASELRGSGGLGGSGRVCVFCMVAVVQVWSGE